MSYDFRSLSSDLLARSESLCMEWFPSGKKRGHEFVVGDLGGSPGESLSINLNTGVWRDFASGEGGGDLIALYAAMHGIEQGEAYKRLTNGHAPEALSRPAAPKPKPKPEPEIVMPVPGDIGPPSMHHKGFGAPSASWCYRNHAGQVLGFVARYDPADGRKQIVPWVWTKSGWVAKAFPAPRPLYGLDRLGMNLPVLLVEGEKAADAAQAIVGERYAVLTWPGGAQAVQKAHFEEIAGRKVLLWPDADKPGIEVMAGLAQRLVEICPEVKLLDVAGMPDGWDAADSGFDWDRFREWAKPRAAVVEKKTALPAEVKPPKKKTDAPKPLTFGLWDRLGLALNDKGAPLNNLDNVVRSIEGDPQLKGRIWYDEFLDAIVTTWQGPQRVWKDADDVLLQLYMQRHVGLTRIGVQTCHDAALVAAFHDTRNECREWMEGLQWDGFSRLPYLMHEGFGAEENDYTAAVGRNWIVSMVARVMKPGCKVDTVPVLEGSQGAGKSTALSILGGKWFCECHESVLSKDFFGVLQGHMLVEISEMHSFTRAEVERIKGIISCQVDRYRKAYGRNTEDHQRQTVLACTTNRDDWQRDDTGARRFWPIRCGVMNLDFLRNNRDQMFAEAVALYKDGADWWSVPAEMQRDEVEARRDVDVWEPLVDQWLVSRDRTQIHEVLSECLKVDVSRQDQLVQKRVGRILRCLGWEVHVLRKNGKNQREWVRKA
nr:MAG TPA: virulence associated protein E [Caudoviricetes sp.]